MLHMDTSGIALTFAATQSAQTAQVMSLAMIKQQNNMALAINDMLVDALEAMPPALPSGTGGAVDRYA